MGIQAPAGVGSLGTPVAQDQANGVVSGIITAAGTTQPFAFYGPANLSIWSTINTPLTTTNGSTNVSVSSGTELAAGVAINSVNLPRGSTLATFSGTSGTLALPTVSQLGAISKSSRIITGLNFTAGLTGAAISGADIPAGATVSAIVSPAIPGNGTVPTVTGSIQISVAPTKTTNSEELSFALTGNAVISGTDANALFMGAGVEYVGSLQLERSFDGGQNWIVCNVGGQGTLAQWNAGTPVSLTFGEPERGVLYRLNCTAFTSGTINYRLSTTGAAAMSLAVASAI